MGCKSIKKLLENIECEGFDYALVHYDTYDEIPSKEFQQLLKTFKEARQNLVDFLGLTGSE